MSKTYRYTKPGNVAIWKKEYHAAAAEINNLVLPTSYPDTQFSFSNDGFVIVNPETRKAVQTNSSQAQADQHCRWCNEHEALCGRPEIYVVEPLVRPVFED
jgi:hypothetical protein